MEVSSAIRYLTNRMVCIYEEAKVTDNIAAIPSQKEGENSFLQLLRGTRQSSLCS